MVAANLANMVVGGAEANSANLQNCQAVSQSEAAEMLGVSVQWWRRGWRRLNKAQTSIRQLANPRFHSRLQRTSSANLQSTAVSQSDAAEITFASVQWWRRSRPRTARNFGEIFPKFGSTALPIAKLRL